MAPEPGSWDGLSLVAACAAVAACGCLAWVSRAALLSGAREAFGIWGDGTSPFELLFFSWSVYPTQFLDSSTNFNKLESVRSERWADGSSQVPQ